MSFAITLNIDARPTKVPLLTADAAVNRAEGYIVVRVPAAERAACRETPASGLDLSAAALEIRSAEDVANDSPL